MHLRLPATRPHPSPRRRPGGFTLIELMVAVAILAVLAALAAPSFNEAILSNRLASYANSFVASVQLARSEAIKRNATVVMCRSADGLSCASAGTWQQGWILWQDSDNDATVDPDEVIQKQQAISADYHFTADAYTLNFLGTGLVSGGPTAFTLCRAVPEAGRQERALQLWPTGRVSVTKTTSGTCA